MGKKVYAIKEGYDFDNDKKIENLIVNSWDECLKFVKGVKGAKYKSFEDIKEAEKFLNEANKILKKGIDDYPEDCLHVYVDGSYSVSSKKYAYALVAVRNNVVEYIESDVSQDSSQSNIRQIAGELEAAIKSVEYALSKKDKKVVIFHDYEGIAHHATGFWERKEESSIRYYNRMKELKELGIEIIFVKVNSHTGEIFNELADEKCKEKLNISSNKVVDKWLLNNVLYVANENIKRELISITNSKENKIIIVKSKNKNEENKLEEVKLKEEKSIILEIEDLVRKLPIEKQRNVLEYIKEIL